MSGSSQVLFAAAWGGKMTRAIELAQPPIARVLSRWLLPSVVGLFLCSGLRGLTYQVLWLRLLSLVFGIIVWAASTALASFMAGLGIGSLCAGRLAGRVRRPLRWYGSIEILTGLAALATRPALDEIARVYVTLSPLLGDSMTAPTVVRFSCRRRFCSCRRR